MTAQDFDAHGVMKGLGYDAVLLSRTSDVRGRERWGWVRFSRAEPAALSPLRFETSFDAGEDFLAMMGHRTVRGPLPENPHERLLIWSVSMALVGDVAMPIFVEVYE